MNEKKIQKYNDANFVQCIEYNVVMKNGTGRNKMLHLLKCKVRQDTKNIKMINLNYILIFHSTKPNKNNKIVTAA
jgi:hypothetical protein